MKERACAEIVAELRRNANPRNVQGMARFGINPGSALGISVKELRRIARTAGKDHDLALELWTSGIHEARILACLVDEPSMVTEKQMEAWAKDFDSWDLCDQCCMNLFDKTRFAYGKAAQWSTRDGEFVRRAGFALMASLAVHDKEADDARFVEFLRCAVRAADDDRNYVKKAVSWALRQIGKRNNTLNRKAIETAEEIAGTGTRAGRWLAADVRRELTRNDVVAKLLEKPDRRSRL